MLLRRIFMAVAGVIVLGLIWRLYNSNMARDWLHPQPTRSTAIKFQNDSPSVPAPAAAASAQPDAHTAGLPRGTPRKCQKGSSVVYTDGDCPAGMQEHALRAGTINVIPGTPAAAPPPRLATARDALRPAGPSLMEQQLEREERR